MKTKLHISFCKMNGKRFLFNKDVLIEPSNYEFCKQIHYIRDQKYYYSFLEFNFESNKLGNCFNFHDQYRVGNKLLLKDFEYLKLDWKEIR